MTEHLVAKLTLAAAGAVGFVAAAMPGSLLGQSDLPFGVEEVEAWARFGVAGGCLLIMVIALCYTGPKMAAAFRAAIDKTLEAHERTIDRICTSHAASMREMRIEQREDSQAIAAGMNRIAESVATANESQRKDALAKNALLQQQLDQLKEIPK